MVLCVFSSYGVSLSASALEPIVMRMLRLSLCCLDFGFGPVCRLRFNILLTSCWILLLKHDLRIIVYTVQFLWLACASRLCYLT